MSFLHLIIIFGILPIIELFLNPETNINNQSAVVLFKPISNFTAPVHCELLPWFTHDAYSKKCVLYNKLGLSNYGSALSFTVTCLPKYLNSLERNVEYSV